MMTSKPKNQFEEDKKRREHERNKYYHLLREKQVKRRTGLSRKQQQLRIQGMAMFLITSPEIVRERFIRVSKLDDYGSSMSRGRTYHFAIWRYSLRSEDGRLWTALQAQCHDANHGWMLNVTGLYNLKECFNG